jgi:hypothetical protein
MDRWIAALLWITLMVAPLAAAAQEPGQTSPPPPNLPEFSPPSPEMLQQMLDLWRRLGPESPLNAGMFQGLEELLQSGRLTPEGQKKLRDLAGHMERLTQENFSPANPENQRQYQDLINHLKGLVKNLAEADQTGKAER